MSYADFIKRNIFDELNMQDSLNGPTIITDERHAKGYDVKFKDADYVDMSFYVGAGSLVSTVEDLYKWKKALFGGKFKKYANKMFENKYGIFDKEFFNRRNIHHTGSVEGFKGFISTFVREDISIICLQNIWILKNLSSDLIAITFGEEIEPLTEEYWKIINDVYQGKARLEDIIRLVPIAKDRKRLYMITSYAPHINYLMHLKTRYTKFELDKIKIALETELDFQNNRMSYHGSGIDLQRLKEEVLKYFLHLLSIETKEGEIPEDLETYIFTDILAVEKNVDGIDQVVFEVSEICRDA
jgi:hypothetical protein